jgi:lipopolysaccharide biosynthesis regulator YciM
LFTDDNEILAAEAAKAADDGAPAPALSTWCELKGSKLHLTAEYTKASEAFELACSYDSGNVNAPLKMAMLHMDTGDNDKCLAVYDDILAKCDGDAALFPLAGKAWALAHRSSYWTTRDEKSKYMPEACEKSRADIDASLDITGTLFNTILV